VDTTLADQPGDAAIADVSTAILDEALLVFAALTGRTESQPSIVGSLLVFYTTGSDGARSLNVVSMEDGADLKSIGRVSTASRCTW